MGSLSTFDLALFIAIPLGYAALQTVALRTWDGVWKRTAWLGLAAALGLALWVLVGWVTGSDLWPLPLLLGLPILFGSFAVLSLTRWLLNR